MATIYLGYDPGGGGVHGVAAIDDCHAECGTTQTAQHAIEWFLTRCQGREAKAFGVDTLTLWSTGPAGWRPADRALRRNYPQVANSVMSPNALFGAMPINGIAVALALRQSLPNMKITETHPKVLYFSLTGFAYDFVQNRNGMVRDLENWIGRGPCGIVSEHAWDALVSAFAAREWDTAAWANDLHTLPSQPGETLIHAHGSRSYYAWPEDLDQRSIRTQQAPSKGSGVRAQRTRDRWKVAVEILERAGHDDVAQQVAGYRNARNERSGWDAWLKSNFPALWQLVEEAGD